MAINKNVLAEKQATVLAEDGNVMYATIQMRHGKESEMDKSKFVPAEIGVATDTKKAFMAFSPGNVKEMMFREDSEIEELLGEVRKISDQAVEAVESAEATAKQAIEDYTEQMKATIPEDYTAIVQDIADLKSDLSDLYEMNPSEGSQIYDILEYGAERWDGKRISGTTIVNAGSNYYGYILDRSKIEKEVRLIVSNNPASAVIINEQNPEIGNTISVSETLTATSVGSGGYQYTITPGEGYLLFYRQGEFSYAFICEEINLSKDLDIPGETSISGSLDFATKGIYSGFKLPDIPSDTIVFLKVSDDVNLASIQILDISGEAAEGITTAVNTNSTVMCWISNGKPAMLRYGKSNNASVDCLFEPRGYFAIQKEKCYRKLYNVWGIRK